MKTWSTWEVTTQFLKQDQCVKEKVTNHQQVRWCAFNKSKAKVYLTFRYRWGEDSTTHWIYHPTTFGILSQSWQTYFSTPTSSSSSSWSQFSILFFVMVTILNTGKILNSGEYAWTCARPTPHHGLVCVIREKKENDIDHRRRRRRRHRHCKSQRQGKSTSCTDNTSPYARMRTFFSLHVTIRTIHPTQMHWLKMFERFCVSLQDHHIRAPCHSWVFLSSLFSLLSCFRLRRLWHRWLQLD